MSCFFQLKAVMDPVQKMAVRTKMWKLRGIGRWHYPILLCLPQILWCMKRKHIHYIEFEQKKKNQFNCKADGTGYLLAPALDTSLKFRGTFSASRTLWKWSWWPTTQGRLMLCKILSQGRQFWLDIASLGLAYNPSIPSLSGSSSGSETVDLSAELMWYFMTWRYLSS